MIRLLSFIGFLVILVILIPIVIVSILLLIIAGVVIIVIRLLGLKQCKYYEDFSTDNALEDIYMDQLHETVFERCSLDIGDLKIKYIKSKIQNPESVIIFHGSYASSIPFIPAGCKIADKYSVYIVDLPGWGFSDNYTLPETNIIEFQVQILYDIICKLQNNKPSIIVAHSLSAYFVIKLAKIHPEIFQKIILVSPAGIFPVLSSTGAYWAILFQTSMHSQLIKYMSVFILSIITFFSNNILLCFSAILLSKNMTNSKLIKNFIHLSPTNVYWKDPCLTTLLSINVPIGLIYGENDPLIPVYQGCLLSLLTNGNMKCMVIKNAFHAPHNQKFIDQFNLAFNDAIKYAIIPKNLFDNTCILYFNKILPKFKGCFNTKLTNKINLRMYRKLSKNNKLTLTLLKGIAKIY